jgi:hypothetical protein
MTAGDGQLRTEITAVEGRLRTEIAATEGRLRAEIVQGNRDLVKWIATVFVLNIVTIAGLVIALVRLLVFPGGA